MSAGNDRDLPSDDGARKAAIHSCGTPLTDARHALHERELSWHSGEPGVPARGIRFDASF